ncbi:MAG: hypothetical protein ACR2PT_05145, partial [Endozoicomonas sp.]
MLNGDSSDLEFQIGATAGDTIQFGIDSMTGADLGEGVQDAKVSGVDEKGETVDLIRWTNTSPVLD